MTEELVHHNNYITNRLIVTGPPDDIAAFEEWTGTNLPSIYDAVRLEASPYLLPASVHVYNGEDWEAVEHTSLSSFTTYLEQLPIITRSYQLPYRIGTYLPHNLQTNEISPTSRLDTSNDYAFSLATAMQHTLFAQPPRRADNMTDEDFVEQSTWERIGAEERGDFDFTGAGVTIAVFDVAPELSEIDPATVDCAIYWEAGKGLIEVESYPIDLRTLKSVKVVGAADNRTDSPEDELDINDLIRYHGLMNAGLLRQLAPDANIVLVAFEPDDGTTTGTQLLQALNHLLYLRATAAETEDGRLLVDDKLIIQVNFGYQRSQAYSVEAPYLLEFCDRAADQGVMIVCPSGHDSLSGHPANPREPAAYGFFQDTTSTHTHVIAVGATGIEPTEYAWFSNRADIGAPGLDILLDTGANFAHSGSRYVYWSGTSFAASFVTGSVALLLEAGMQPEDVKQLLWDSITRPDRWDGLSELHIGDALGIIAEELETRPDYFSPEEE